MAMAKVALCVIATNYYIDFVPDLYNSMQDYFLVGHQVDMHVFTNYYTLPPPQGMYLHKVEHAPWPAMTLNRYSIILSADLSAYDYVYYIDADSRFVAPVGGEILKDMVVVEHPGYAAKGGGAWEGRAESAAYVPPSLRTKYVCGGFQGGAHFLRICAIIEQAIQYDKWKCITAIWHDESHLNRAFASLTYFSLLDCSYMMPESLEKRKAWGIAHIEPKILALEKDHKKYQK